MTAKEKVLKLKPNAYCQTLDFGNKKDYHIWVDDFIYARQYRESWAWAEAYRLLINT